MDLRELCEWTDSGESEHTAKAGVFRRLVCESPPPRFWNLWRTAQRELRAAGVRSVRRPDGSWFAIWLVPAADLEPDLPPPVTGDGAVAIPPDIAPQLLPWQPPAVLTLARALRHHGGAFDASLTGTGKTTAALAAVRTCGLSRVVVVCPVNVVPNWQDWATKFGLDHAVINYEMAIKGIPGILERIPGRHVQYEWHGKGYAIVFDEGHRIGGLSTLNSKLAIHAARRGLPVLVASATIGDSPLRMKAIGTVLRLFKEKGYWLWAREHGVVPSPRYGYDFIGGDYEMGRIRKSIFNAGKGVRLDPADIPGFPEASIDCLTVETGASSRINSAFDEIQSLLGELARRPKESGGINERIHELWQRVELMKLPAAVELLKDAVEGGSAGLLFVHYRYTAQEAGRMLGWPVIIGQQKPAERQAIIKDLATDRIPGLVSTSAAGSEGISCHDVTGRHPRYEIIFPSGSSRLARQCVGRAWRAGGKTKAIIRFMIASGTHEVDRSKRLIGKLNRLDALTDVDFLPFASADSAALAMVLNPEERK